MLPEGKIVIALDGRLAAFIRVTIRRNASALELTVKEAHGGTSEGGTQNVGNNGGKDLPLRSAQTFVVLILLLSRATQTVRRGSSNFTVPPCQSLSEHGHPSPPPPGPPAPTPEACGR